jgi:hypothetical protein
MKPLLLSLALLPALASAAAAQDGGKIVWKGKGADSLQAAFEDALRDAKPIVLFFSIEGDAACKELSSGAFSSDDVVQASSALTCLFVDCTKGKNSALVSNLKLKKVPSIVFMDPSGVPLADIQHRDAPSLATAMTNLALMFSTLPRFPEDVDAALATARKQDLPLLLYFYDDSPASLAVNKSMSDAELKPLRERFAYARAPMRKGSDVCVKYDVGRAPTILVLDASLPTPESKPLAKIVGSRNPRELRRDLEDALTATGSAAAAAPAPPLPTSPTRKEDLSDDALDRKFIQARIAVAKGLIQQGKSKEAIGVLEDVIKTYPKHVATGDAVQLLEKLKK